MDLYLSDVDLSAAQALDLGLVHEVAPDKASALARALDYASSIASHPAGGLRRTMALYRRALPKGALEQEALSSALCLQEGSFDAAALRRRAMATAAAAPVVPARAAGAGAVYAEAAQQRPTPVVSQGDEAGAEPAGADAAAGIAVGWIQASTAPAVQSSSMAESLAAAGSTDELQAAPRPVPPLPIIAASAEGQPAAVGNVPAGGPARRASANAGIHAIECYVPGNATKMDDMEALLAPSLRGKVSGRLNIHEVVFPGPDEDQVSLALTALARLCERHGVPWSSIGRLEVRRGACECVVVACWLLANESVTTSHH